MADLLTEQLRRGGRGGSVTEEVGTYRGFNVSVQVAGNGRFAGLSSLFDFKAEVHLRAEAGGACYVAQVGESNVGVTQSMDYQLRHIEAQLEQARSKLLMLETRLTKAGEEVNRPWGPAGEYNRLRREYEALSETLQAEGVALESNTAFAEETGPEENPVAAEAEDQAAPDTAASLSDTGITRNPFTGLEEWPLVAAECAVVATEASPAQITPTQIGLLPFNTATDESDAPCNPTSGAISLLPLNLRPVLEGKKAVLPLLAQANLPLAGLTGTTARPPKKPHPRRSANNGPARKQDGWLWND